MHFQRSSVSPLQGLPTESIRSHEFSFKAHFEFNAYRRWTKRLNREQTATLQTALLHPPAWLMTGGCGPRYEPTQRGSFPVAWIWPCGPTRG
jgi:hypothetical protein